MLNWEVKSRTRIDGTFWSMVELIAKHGPTVSVVRFNARVEHKKRVRSWARETTWFPPKNVPNVL